MRSIVYRRLRKNEKTNPRLSLSANKDGTFNVFNEANDTEIGNFHPSRLYPSFSDEQLNYVKEHGTTNFVATRRTRDDFLSPEPEYELVDKEKIFILDSQKAFSQAERFKAELENEGLQVTTTTYGFNGVRIRGFGKRRV